MNKKLPLIIHDDSPRGRSIKTSDRKQVMLLKGIAMHPDNFKKAAQYAGIRTMAEAYKTLDLLALRKDFHRALDANDVTMDYIVQGIKGIADNADLDSTRLNAFRILLKSLGLETYKEQESSTRTWEDVLTETVQAELIDTNALPGERYEVNVPQIPEAARKQREKEDAIGKELYGE